MLAVSSFPVFSLSKSWNHDSLVMHRCVVRHALKYLSQLQPGFLASLG
jgi:hypothetical protein